MTDITAPFQAINLDDKVIASISKNKKVVAKLTKIIELAGGKADKHQGNLLYALSTKLPPTQDPWVKSFVDQIVANKWTKVMQIEEAITWMKERLVAVGDAYVIDQAGFDQASGVGINLSDADIQALVDEAFTFFKAEIDEQKYEFGFNKIIFRLKEMNKWADSKIVMVKIAEK